MKTEIDDCYWYPDTDEFTGRRVWVADSCYGTIEPELTTTADWLVSIAAYCPWCGKPICETTHDDLEAEKRADEEYRYGVANGLYGYGG